MMMPGNGQLSVPPGFRFHPTDEELLYYYLKKKVSYEAIELDVIREIDLNKLEPWDLKDKCRIGSGPQNDWYFFSHKDKKYPTGTRTNRATTAGFWKATGRDKAIHLSNSKRIGMRKTLVFYTGRAPHGQKTDWIMHEYRLEDDNNYSNELQEDGWVVCRVFKKKNHNYRDFTEHQHQHGMGEDQEQHFNDHHHHHHMKSAAGSSSSHLEAAATRQNHHHHLYDFTQLDSSMHLPQLFSPESAFVSPVSLNSMDIECSQNLLRLTSNSTAAAAAAACGVLLQAPVQQQERFHGDWSFLDKLLASHSQHNHHGMEQNCHAKCNINPSSSSQVIDHLGVGTSTSTQPKFQFQYLGCEADVLKFSK